LKKKFEQHHRISVERVVSGTGLYNVSAGASVKSVHLGLGICM
jgi:glucokinase